MNNNEQLQIQLELPDYSEEYQNWLKKQNEVKKEQTVVVIDIF